jgi:BirA family transcriptional regulator, biotin operon repressor / biotin---[acetyl-CoA-carboxylase] ligase
VGINCRRDETLEIRVRRQVAFLSEYCTVSRNVVIQKIGAALLEALECFEKHGLDALRAEWEAMDAHAGQKLRVRLADGRMLSGIASGLAPDGSLQLHTKRGMRAVTSGRVVSARAA